MRDMDSTDPTDPTTTARYCPHCHDQVADGGWRSHWERCGAVNSLTYAESGVILGVTFSA